MVIILAASILPLHRSLGSAIGKLFGAAFFVFAMSMAISYATPWMGSWWRYLPIPFLQSTSTSSSPWLLQSCLHIGFTAAAWIATREKARTAILWPPEPEQEGTDEQTSA